MRVFRAVSAVILLMVGSGLCAAAEEGSANGDPLPITVSAKPSSVWVGRPVTVTGESVAAPKLDTVTITIRSTTAKQSAPVQIRISLDGGGKFTGTYTPTAAGTYEVDATAPDGHGHAQTTFVAQQAASPDSSTVGIIGQSAGDALSIVEQAKAQITPLPPNPAKDDLLKAIASLEPAMQQLAEESGKVAQPLSDLIRISGRLRLTDALQSERDTLLADLAAAEEARKRTREVLDNLKNRHTTCDDLEVVSEGFKWTGVLLNFAVGEPSGAAMNFARDMLAALATQGVQLVGGGEAAQFGTSEVIKSTDAASINTVTYYESAIKDFGKKTRVEYVNLDANTIVSRVNDLAGLAAAKTMAAYCVDISGPVRAHMHAQFFKNGNKWWEYSFDLFARLSLHYPRAATGDQIAVNGHLEGYGTNFTLWENGLTVQFPELMSSTVQRKFVIPPPAIPIPASGALPPQYSSEGSVFGALATPNAFFFQTTGRVSKDKLQFTVGAVRTDQNPKAQVVAILVPALTAGLPTWSSYALPYKDAHFVFERTSNNVFEIPLTTVGKTITGQRHFDDRRDNGDAKGEYSVDVKVCNPGC
jgi:hypothetical protein